MAYVPAQARYQHIPYARCGNSGLKLPRISLGLWQNFGAVDSYETARSVICRAFDLGITHFDLANNYGPPPGSAESTFGRILRNNFKQYRDELIISTKAGYDMWPGPYGDRGSRKYMIASLDQSLKRLGIDYVDIFYSHRFDPETPLEETMGSLAHAVRTGKALYAGISNYPPDKTEEAYDILRTMGVRCLLHQVKYSMFDRSPEAGLFSVLEKLDMGCIVFSPLAQGLLTDRYLKGVPKNSRANKPHGFLKKEHITQDVIEKVRDLNGIAADRKQSLAQLALVWVLRSRQVTSALIGASSVKQLENNVGALSDLSLDNSETGRIERILAQ
ncbi:aldo/keto reductase [bacterium]|nr:aldo/keto reductase [bacterium]